MKANKMKDNKCVWKKETLGMPLKRNQECVADAFSKLPIPGIQEDFHWKV